MPLYFLKSKTYIYESSNAKISQNGDLKRQYFGTCIIEKKLTQSMKLLSLLMLIVGCSNMKKKA